MSSSGWLDNYEPLDVIGNGSFGIIRKVRRKSDGLIFARKELNFERMSERDRKQIVAEVNILKDLHHDHIVRYHDRYVDRDAGILYILMEYCGGGDLSTIIKQAAKHNRPIPEDTIWHYFLQILLALHHCHHPNGHARSSSGGGLSAAALEAEGNSRRVQILHRDLKPDNVFLDENNSVKLGDFGLSKALAQASFANTYVGTPYYMSPELMQEKAYDSKSDIWSLGCLIYELCALKPPFHEAKTHSELSIFIRNGRIPPLPRGYSQALTSVIKSMLNLNPAMRPSAAQLLQHERLELVYKVAETEKMLATVKSHRAAVNAKEREVLAREQALHENERQLSSLLASKDTEITALQSALSQAQTQLQTLQTQPIASPEHIYTQRDLESAIKAAVSRREDELRLLVIKREEEVARAIAQREEEIMEAVRSREAEVDRACREREAEILKEVEERMRWVGARERELSQLEEGLEEERRGVEEERKRVEEMMEKAQKGRKDKSPLEEVKNVLEPLNRVAHPAPSTQATPLAHQGPQNQRRRTKLDATPTPRVAASSSTSFPSQLASAAGTGLETPLSRASAVLGGAGAAAAPAPPLSAMKGVVLTSTGQAIATPSPAEILSLFERSPKVGLNFGKIFDFGEAEKMKALTGLGGQGGVGVDGEDTEEDEPPPSPSERRPREKAAASTSRSTRRDKGKEREANDQDKDDVSETSSGSGATTGSTKSAGKSTANGAGAGASQQQQQQAQPQQHPPTRLRRPSIRSSARSAPLPAQAAAQGQVQPQAQAQAPSPLARAGTMPTIPISTSDSQITSSSSSSASSSLHPLPSAHLHPQAAAAGTQGHHSNPKPLPHPHLRKSRSGSNLNLAAAAAARASGASKSNHTTVFPLPIPVPRNYPSPDYDLEDEENLPSPFLKRVEREKGFGGIKGTGLNFPSGSSSSSSASGSASRAGSSSSASSCSGSSSSSSASGSSGSNTSSTAVPSTKTKRHSTASRSSGLLLRAVAAANSAGRRINGGALSPTSTTPTGEVPGEGDGEMQTVSGGPGSSGGSGARPSLASARKASEEARKALGRV